MKSVPPLQNAGFYLLGKPSEIFFYIFYDILQISIATYPPYLIMT